MVVSVKDYLVKPLHMLVLSSLSTFHVLDNDTFNKLRLSKHPI